MEDIILEVKDICKSFSTVEMLHRISFEIRRGEILGIIGENGADKEILKMIMGDSNPLVKAYVTYPPDCIATAAGLAVLGYNKQTFEVFYQKKLPVRIILAAELITKENAKQYYEADELNFEKVK